MINGFKFMSSNDMTNQEINQIVNKIIEFNENMYEISKISLLFFIILRSLFKTLKLNKFDY